MTAPATTSFKAKPLVASAWKIIPFFRSHDIHETVRLYTQELGFSLGSEEPGFCSLYAGPKAAANIYFRLHSDESDFPPSGAVIAMGAEQLEELYKGLLARREQAEAEGLPSPQTFKIVTEIKDEEWGRRQFTIEDGDGNQLSFFRFLEGSNGEEYWDVEDPDGTKADS